LDYRISLCHSSDQRSCTAWSATCRLDAFDSLFFYCDSTSSGERNNLGRGQFVVRHLLGHCDKSVMQSRAYLRLVAYVYKMLISFRGVRKLRNDRLVASYLFSPNSDCLPMAPTYI
jgi:hypothetical protein